VLGLCEQVVEGFKLAWRLQWQDFGGHKIKGQGWYRWPKRFFAWTVLVGLIKSTRHNMSESKQPFTEHVTQAKRGSDTSRLGWIRRLQIRHSVAAGRPLIFTGWDVSCWAGRNWFRVRCGCWVWASAVCASRMNNNWCCFEPSQKQIGTLTKQSALKKRAANPHHMQDRSCQICNQHCAPPPFAELVSNPTVPGQISRE
jgi:hypothetical protein